MNEVVLSGTAHGVNDLRYTPAGIAVLEFSLRHTSTQAEAGQSRRVELEMPAVAFGGLAERLARASVASRPITARGFLAKRSLRSTQIVLHARDVEFQ